MYSLKLVDFGFVILCAERNIAGLKGTVRSIRNHYADSPCVCATSEDAKDCELAEMNLLCPTYRAGNTYTSVINEGLKNSKADWNFLVFSGSYVKCRFYHKYGYFLEDEKDVMFPIVDQIWNFVDGSLNGIFLHKQTMKELGNLEEKGELPQAKLKWMLKGLRKDYRFKAILGARLA